MKEIYIFSLIREEMDLHDGNIVLVHMSPYGRYYNKHVGLIIIVM